MYSEELSWKLVGYTKDDCSHLSEDDLREGEAHYRKKDLLVIGHRVNDRRVNIGRDMIISRLNEPYYSILSEAYRSEF